MGVYLHTPAEIALEIEATDRYFTRVNDQVEASPTAVPFKMHWRGLLSDWREWKKEHTGILHYTDRLRDVVYDKARHFRGEAARYEKIASAATAGTLKAPVPTPAEKSLPVDLPEKTADEPLIPTWLKWMAGIGAGVWLVSKVRGAVAPAAAAPAGGPAVIILQTGGGHEGIG